MKHPHFAAALISLAFGLGAPAASAQQLTCQRLLTGLDRPTAIASAPGDFARLFIVQNRGQIRTLDLATNTLRPAPFLDLTSRVATATYLEFGVLGMAFHPQYAANGYFYIVYTPIPATGGSNADWVLSRFRVSSTDANTADPSSEQVILRFSYTRVQHRAGWVGFGNDGYLYMTTGDGGENDPDNAASNVTNTDFGRRGKMLRIDVNGPDGQPGTADDDAFPADANKHYVIPPTNPFATDATKAPEIWAYGLRNPWRAAVDPATGDIFIGDVGQSTREEIDVIRSGDTPPFFFGWRCREGATATTFTGCPSALGSGIAPLVDIPRTLGFSVTGGVVYRGCAMPALRGSYIYSDWGSSRAWTLTYDRTTNTATNQIERTSELAVAGQTPLTNITAFGTDGLGEVYWVRSPGYTSANQGELYKLVPRALAAPDCNNNARPDPCEIAAGLVADANHNGIPDPCEAPTPCTPSDVASPNQSPGPDGLLTADDIIVFLGWFFAGDGRADIAGANQSTVPDSSFTADDIIVFLGRFFQGC